MGVYLALLNRIVTTGDRRPLLTCASRELVFAGIVFGGCVTCPARTTDLKITSGNPNGTFTLPENVCNPPSYRFTHSVATTGYNSSDGTCTTASASNASVLISMVIVIGTTAPTVSITMRSQLPGIGAYLFAATGTLCSLTNPIVLANDLTAYGCHSGPTVANTVAAAHSGTVTFSL